MTGIFASPTLKGVTRWAYSNASLTRKNHPFVNELTVNPDAVFVYSVDAWEEVSLRDSGYEKYWESGITLTEWMNRAEELDPTEWELLLSPSDIASMKNVSDKRVLSSLDEDDWRRDELTRALKDSRRACAFA